jgi:dienelactone hydrolase
MEKVRIIQAIGIVFFSSFFFGDLAAYSQYWIEEDVRIPMVVKSFGETKTIHLVAKIYRPQAAGPFPLVVINHGTPGTRPALKTFKPPYRKQSTFFVSRGWVAVVPSRRGHGDSEGDYAESFLTPRGGINYHASAVEGAKDIRTVIRYMGEKPYVQANRTLLTGVSSGGFVSLGYGSFYPQEIIGIINFSGGKKPVNEKKARDPRLLIRTVGDFGKISRAQTLWLYAEDDNIFDPPTVREMFAEYQRAGGKGKLHILPPRYGHRLFVKGMEMWIPLVDAFLKEINRGR